MMKKLSELLFHGICLGFAAVMIVLSLLTSIQLAAVNDEAARLEREAEALKTENARLQVQVQTSLSLEEIERYATQVLGMRRQMPGQIYYIQLPTE